MAGTTRYNLSIKIDRKVKLLHLIVGVRDCCVLGEQDEPSLPKCNLTHYHKIPHYDALKIYIPTAINNASLKVHDVVFVFLTKGVILVGTL